MKHTLLGHREVDTRLGFVSLYWVLYRSQIAKIARSGMPDLSDVAKSVNFARLGDKSVKLIVYR